MRRRRGLWLALGGAFFLAASTGVFASLFAFTPLGLFQYAEKYVAPATLLVALAAAHATLEERRLAAAAAAVFVAARIALAVAAPALRTFLIAHGRVHAPSAADALIDALGWSFLVSAAFSALLCVAAALRLHFLAATTVAGFALFNARIPALPLELFHAPRELVPRMEARAGPSPGRWRLRTDGDLVYAYERFDARTGTWLALSQLMLPQVHALAGIEGVTSHAALPDADYGAAFQFAPGSFNRLFGVRFHLREPMNDPLRQHYEPALLGWWMKELPRAAARADRRLRPGGSRADRRAAAARRVGHRPPGGGPRPDRRALSGERHGDVPAACAGTDRGGDGDASGRDAGRGRALRFRAGGRRSTASRSRWCRPTWPRSGSPCPEGGTRSCCAMLRRGSAGASRRRWPPRFCSPSPEG